jgi:hypothetical protein
MAPLQRHPEVVFTDLGDGAVLLHGETKFFYSLDHVGAAVWRLLDTTGGMDGLVQALAAEYGVEPATARESVSGFLDELEREQLVTRDLAAPANEPVTSSPDDTARSATRAEKKPLTRPELVKHAEPLHAVVMNPFDPQLPLAE